MGVGQLFGELAGLMLGAHEQDPTTHPGGERLDEGTPQGLRVDPPGEEVKDFIEYAELYRAADEALLRAKREGRSRACIYVESKMVLKSNYYPKSQLERLAKLSAALGRTEASLLREALDDLIEKYRGEL